MANNLTVSYKGNTIHTASASGSATLNTAGKYMEGNVNLSYTFDGGGGADLSSLEIYVADYLNSPPTVTEGALDKWRRVIVS